MGLMEALAVAGNILDLPGSSLRDVLMGENPFDQWRLSNMTSSENRATGRDLLRRWNWVGEEDTTGNLLGGVAAEMALDPLNLIGGGLLKALKMRRAGRSTKGATLSAEDIARAEQEMEWGIMKGSRTPEQATDDLREALLGEGWKPARVGFGTGPEEISPRLLPNTSEAILAGDPDFIPETLRELAQRDTGLMKGSIGIDFSPWEGTDPANTIYLGTVASTPATRGSMKSARQTRDAMEEFTDLADKLGIDMRGGPSSMAMGGRGPSTSGLNRMYGSLGGVKAEHGMFRKARTREMPLQSGTLGKDVERLLTRDIQGQRIVSNIWSPKGSERITEGYAVPVFGKTKRSIPVSEFSADDVDKFVSDWDRLLRESGARHSLMREGDDIIQEVVLHTPELGEAGRAGLAYKLDDVWDTSHTGDWQEPRWLGGGDVSKEDILRELAVPSEQARSSLETARQELTNMATGNYPTALDERAVRESLKDFIHRRTMGDQMIDQGLVGADEILNQLRDRAVSHGFSESMADLPIEELRDALGGIVPSPVSESLPFFDEFRAMEAADEAKRATKGIFRDVKYGRKALGRDVKRQGKEATKLAEEMFRREQAQKQLRRAIMGNRGILGAHLLGQAGARSMPRSGRSTLFGGNDEDSLY